MKHIAVFIFLFVILSSCKKFVTADPPKNLITQATVFNSDLTATAAMRGIYSQMTGGSGFASGGPSSITVLAGLSADEFIDYTGSKAVFQNNNLSADNSDVFTYFWAPGFQYIYGANAIIDGLNQSSGVTAATKTQLIGEAKFIRAFANFYLLNFFGDIPLITQSDYRINIMALRSKQSVVYEQVITDLEDARSTLPGDYGATAGERIRPNKWAATALLARVYLNTGDNAKAEAAATDVINNSSMYSLLPNLAGVFLKNSTEAIWQLAPSSPVKNTFEGQIFILTGSPNFVSLSNTLLLAFEPGDMRKKNWVNSITTGTNTFYFAYKYQKGNETVSTQTEYYMILRLAEQFLIRAEARALQNNIPGALADLNVIRNRAGLPNSNAADKQSLLTAVQQENRIELFAEWGHRWLDLKRTGTADSILTVLKTPNWQTTDIYYPIPQKEISNDPNLTQNPGY